MKHHCKQCKKLFGLFGVIESDETPTYCIKCNKQLFHTFCYGDKVKYISNCFRPPEMRIGIVLNREIHEGNYSTYLVRFSDNVEVWIYEKHLIAIEKNTKWITFDDIPEEDITKGL